MATVAAISSITPTDPHIIAVMDLAAKRQRTGHHYCPPVSFCPNTSPSIQDGAPSTFNPLSGSYQRPRPTQTQPRKAGTVGCSYYSAQEKKLYLLGDMRHSNTEIYDTLILQIKPTKLLTSTRVEYLNRNEQQSGQENSARPYLPYQPEVRPSQEFNPTHAQNKLVELEISSTYEDSFRFLVPHNGLAETEQLDQENLDFTLQEGRHLHMGSFLDLENRVTLGCAGALLTYLQRRRSSDLVSGSPSALYEVTSLEMSTLSGTMLANVRTLTSLQIIESEFHPNMVNQGPGKKSSSSKEGLSVYGLFQPFACTPQGKQRLRQIFLRPSVQLDTIQERHAFISVFLQADNYNPWNKIVKGLRRIKNLRPVMINLQKGISTGSGKVSGFKTTVWATLLAFAFYGIDVHDSLRETTGAHGIILYNKARPTTRQALHAFEKAQLYRVGRMIQEIVDIDSSDEQGRTVVKPGLDRELDRMKDSYDGLDSLLRQVAIEIASTIPASFDIDVNVIYFPQLGFNIAIPLTNGEAAYNGSADGWELIFMTENRAYFKDFKMKEMDEKLGDIYGLICEKEIEIVYDLAQRVLQFERVLVEASDVCGEIDSLLAMAQAVTSYNLVCPKMVQDNIIKIKGGRHILHELTVSSFLPNDAFLVGGRLEEHKMDHSQHAPEELRTGSNPSMLLLTGPNYSGKSVYMKQIALIVYLAQTGSFVPAESAEIGVVDKILVKSNSQDSVSQIQSTFMNDLQQISFDLRHITGRSLLLIDEFGKGTSENDGIGLACGILEYLLSLEDAPKVIAATHFHEILANEFLRVRPRLQLSHMEVRVSEETQEPDDQITYLYNFRLGRSDKSFGTICAALNGINQAIVDRANELASLSARGENLIAACAVLSAEEMQALQDADELARRFLAMDLSDACEGVDLMALLGGWMTRPSVLDGISLPSSDSGS
ncbi:MutS family protein MSH5 [Aspergillus lucknowensis]|uniref:Muts domain V-domain-containing protein n=1 Tax=Aspergillus lucknowensis TaxID=176173 RepID=A0ABR4M5W0_9EURO